MSNNHSGRTKQRHGIAIGEGAIRKIFPVFVVAMWIVAGVWIGTDTWTSTNTAMVIAAAISCAVLFINFVYVFNYGYAISAIAVNAVVLFAEGFPLGATIIGGLLVLYGIRLFWFVHGRYQQPGFAGRKAGLKVAHQQLPTPIKVVLYVQTTTLMAFHGMATYAVAKDAQASGTNGVTPFVIVGAVIFAIGLVIEALADSHKQRNKIANVSRWVDTGLFARTRHPNYLGEIIVQVGIIVAGVGSAVAWYGYAAVILAPLYIIVLMLSATTGGEISKRTKYGEDPEFQAYLDRSGALLPAVR